MGGDAAEPEWALLVVEAELRVLSAVSSGAKVLCKTYS